MTDTITLTCLVHGDAVEHAFAVDISNNKLVSHLKDEIKKKKENDFCNIDADKLILWKVNISYDEEDTVKQLVLTETNTVKKMSPVSKISKHFGNEPMEEHIHIVIECPPGK